MGLPLPPGAKPSVTKSPSQESSLVTDNDRDGSLEADEASYILDTCLKKKNRADPTVIRFIDAFIKCKHIGEASEMCNIKPSLGYMIRHRADVANCIQRLIDRSLIKYGFDASEIMERAKEIVDFDPIMMQNPDGTFKDNLHDIDPVARRNLKKLKVHNLYAQKEDMNGMSKKIIVGKVIEYEFYDKLKAVELVGKEKEMFKTTTKVEHTVTKDMASILLASAERGRNASLGYQDKGIVDAEVVESGE